MVRFTWAFRSFVLYRGREGCRPLCYGTKILPKKCPKTGQFLLIWTFGGFPLTSRFSACFTISTQQPPGAFLFHINLCCCCFFVRTQNRGGIRVPKDQTVLPLQVSQISRTKEFSNGKLQMQLNLRKLSGGNARTARIIMANTSIIRGVSVLVNLEGRNNESSLHPRTLLLPQHGPLKKHVLQCHEQCCHLVQKITPKPSPERKLLKTAQKRSNYRASIKVGTSEKSSRQVQHTCATALQNSTPPFF